MEPCFSHTPDKRLISRFIQTTVGITCLSCTMAYAEDITVGWSSTGKVHSISLTEGSRTQVYSNTPHRKLNPQHQESLFDGFVVNQLTDPEISYENVYVFGDDGYMSMIPGDVIRNSSVIIATAKDGKMLARRDGGRQIVYPTREDENVPEPIKIKAAFWTWYNAAVIFGNFDNQLAKGGQPLDFTGATGTTYSDYKRPSVFSYNQIICPTTLLAPLTSIDKEWPSKIVLRQFSGKTEEVLPDQIELIFAQGKKAIPVECGGPYIVKMGDNLYYNVYALDPTDS